ncbi:MAG: replication initiation protein, partial [Magnetococcales bacterium]|nr:replication initiation protein [Magnetococcales bacterium]
VALKYAIGMKSAYAIRLYELLKQYQTIGSRVVTIADLR